MGRNDTGDSGIRRIRVMAADSHPIFLAGVASVLTSDPGFEIVGTAANGTQALDRYAVLLPDVLLMDLQMVLKDGTCALRSVLAEFPGARVVILTNYDGDGHVLRAMKAGACGYVIKSSLGRDLLSTVRNVHFGRSGVSLTVGMDLSLLIAEGRLTERELGILRLVAQGQSNKRIGMLLAISEETVKFHMKSILPKLGAKDRTHAVALAIGRGILLAPTADMAIDRQ